MENRAAPTVYRYPFPHCLIVQVGEFCACVFVFPFASLRSPVYFCVVGDGGGGDVYAYAENSVLGSLVRNHKRGGPCR